MRVDLPQAVAANGGKVRVRIAWHYTVPGEFGGRTDWFATKHGAIFEIAQWYPRLCVYDDLRGWDRSEEHTSELQSHVNLVCRLLLEKKKQQKSLSAYDT